MMADAELTDFMRQTMPFMGVIGAEAEQATAEEVRTTMTWRPDLCTNAGLMHGGALMSLADGTGAWCAFLNMAPGSNTTTVESKVNFFRPVTAGTVHATSKPLNVGKRFVTVDTELRNDDGKLVARVTQTQAIL